MIRSISILCVFLALFSGSAELHVHANGLSQQNLLLNSWNEFAFKIEDSKCRVGIASVKLSVSELKPKDGNLVATYSIIVPLSKSNNDTGLIVLPIDITVDELGKKGGVLRGKAYSNKNGATPNTIICEVRPLENKAILLEIITDTRTLNFESRYTVIGTGDRS